MTIEELFQYTPQGEFGIRCWGCGKHETWSHSGKTFGLIMREHGWVERWKDGWSLGYYCPECQLK